MANDIVKMSEKIYNNTYKQSKNFQCEIKRLRIARKLTQETFATALGVDVTSVRNWEHGKNFPHDATCQKIISVLSLTEEEQALLFIVEDKSDNRKLKCSEENKAISERPNKVALSEVEGENAITEAPTDKEAIFEVTPNAKPLTNIFKEKWLKIRKPFVIGVGVWAILCVAIAICFIAIHNDNERIIANISKQIKIAITNPWELIICATILFIVTVGFSVLIYFIIRKIRRK